MIGYTILRKENMDLIREYKLDRFKITEYGLVKERRKKKDLLFWKLRQIRVISNNILEKAMLEMTVDRQKKTSVRYRLFPRSREQED